MRFIGNKELIVSEIKLLLDELNLSNRNLTFLDGFCGTGAVSNAIKECFNIASIDILNWCSTYTRGRLCAAQCEFTQLGLNPFDFFNSNRTTIDGFFYQNYSPGGSQRMYFTTYNAGRIDFFRATIELWKNEDLINQDEYCYLLASLIESISMVSNTAGVYGAFLKHWDTRALKEIEFKKVPASNAIALNANFFTGRIEDLISEIDCDVLYLDPPYTQNQYGTQYHLLETLVLNDNPCISPVTGSRSTKSMRSDWSKDFKSHILFDKILAKTSAKYILFSYSADGFMSKSFIEASMKRYGKPETYLCKKISYRKYTNTKSKENYNHFEYLFFIEKKNIEDVVFESPLNYIGSKAKMVRLIKNSLPKHIDCFTDAFGGGFNVGINIDAQKIIYNDINHFVCTLVESFKVTDTYSYILYLRRLIKKFNLLPQNAESYKNIRNYYNSFPLDKRDPKLLYAVILYGYNQQIRFNSDHDFNNPVGMRWFNDKVLEKLISFSREIKEKDVEFRCLDFICSPTGHQENSFIYFDPPYMLTTGSYNDGKRGFNGWTANAEDSLFSFVEKLDRDGGQFMISYVLEHKGKFNFVLHDWIRDRGYNIVEVDPKLGNNRKEILITNYSENVETSLHNQEQLSETV